MCVCVCVCVLSLIHISEPTRHVHMIIVNTESFLCFLFKDESVDQCIDVMAVSLS